MAKRSVGIVSYVQEGRRINGNTTRITTDEVAPGIGVDLVEKVSFAYVNGVCKMDVEGHKYAFRTKKVRLVDDLRAVLRLSDSKLEQYRTEERK